MNTFPTGNEIIDVLRTFGEIEWRRATTIVSPAEELVAQNRITQPHATSWRYKNSDPKLLKIIKDAVESFQGNVQWIMKIREDKPNCAIVTKKVVDYYASGKTIKNSVTVAESSVAYIGKYEPEWGRLANMDVPKLAEHIKEYVTKHWKN